jgi:acyl carrier protein
MDEIIERLRSVLRDRGFTSDQVSGLQLDANLRETLGADSLDAIEIAMEIEERFGIVIEDAEMKACKTLTDWGQLVGTKVAQKTSPDPSPDLTA